MATNTAYYKNALTGGATNALDGINGTSLSDNDLAFALVSDTMYVYRLNASSGAAESVPDIIAPDNNAGTKRWILQGVYGYAKSGANADITSLTALSGQQTIPSINLTGGQIAFPATAVPSSDANTLDDYEEGACNLSFTCGTSGTITMLRTACRYVKIGSKVTVTGSVGVSSVSSPVGNLLLGSLPFTPIAGNDYVAGIAISLEGLASGAATACMANTVSGSTTVEIVRYNDGAAIRDLAQYVQTSCYCHMNISYFAN